MQDQEKNLAQSGHFDPAVAESMRRAAKEQSAILQNAQIHGAGCYKEQAELSSNSLAGLILQRKNILSSALSRIEAIEARVKTRGYGSTSVEDLRFILDLK